MIFTSKLHNQATPDRQEPGHTDLHTGTGTVSRVVNIHPSNRQGSLFLRSPSFPLSFHSPRCPSLSLNSFLHFFFHHASQGPKGSRDPSRPSSRPLCRCACSFSLLFYILFTHPGDERNRYYHGTKYVSMGPIGYHSTQPSVYLLHSMYIEGCQAEPQLSIYMLEGP